MKSGSIGDIEFLVSEQDVYTFGGMSHQRQIVHAEHAVLEGIPRLQHTGRKLDTISLPIVIDASRPGATPFKQRMETLKDMAAKGDDVPLVLGTSYVGQFVINSVSVSATTQHGDYIQRGSMTLELTEYN